jgi:anaerobic magnesium-protoporphyrin IX monomethyl ester cyclase
MPGQRILLVNPPPIGGIRFTRQGRCQEREEVLGTTKPPYSLVVIAALLRERGQEFRLLDLTALEWTFDQVIARVEQDRFQPTAIVFPSTTPTLEADAAQMARLKRHFKAPIFCFGPHASTVPAEAMAKAPAVDGMFVGEPEDGVRALAALDSLDALATIPSLTFRRGRDVVPHRAKGGFAGFDQMPFPAWDLLPLDKYTLPLEGKPYVLVETSRGCPYTCDFCVAPLHQGHKFRERDARWLVDEIEHARRTLGVEHFYLWGDTVTLNVKSFTRFCDELIARRLDIKWFGNARADNLVDPAFVAKLKASGCWMLSMGVESESDETRRSMEKRLEQQKIRLAIENLRDAGIKSFAFFIYGYPGDTVASMERTTDYALELDPDFANFYPAVPYPGTDLYEKARREGLLASEDWTKMEYSFYVLRGNGLDEKAVMRAITRARRRFFLRPRYLARHVGDLARVLVTKRNIVREVASRFLFGGRAVEAREPANGQISEEAVSWR